MLHFFTQKKSLEFETCSAQHWLFSLLIPSYSLERDHWFSWRAGVNLIGSIGGWITSFSKAQEPVKSTEQDQWTSGEGSSEELYYSTVPMRINEYVWWCVVCIPESKISKIYIIHTHTQTRKFIWVLNLWEQHCVRTGFFGEMMPNSNS